MTTPEKQYVITQSQIDQVLTQSRPFYAERALLRALPEISSGPVAYANFTETGTIRLWATVPNTGSELELIPLYTTPQPAPNQPLQPITADDALLDLIGDYWDAGYTEGSTGKPKGSEANDILHKIRQLLIPLQHITDAECVWANDEDMGDFHDSGVFQTGCGQLWEFQEAGIEENGVRFCHHCGGTVKKASK